MASLIKKIKKYQAVIVVLSLLAIVLLGNKLREFSYASVPRPGETADEYAFGWLGLSLIKDKYPISWSGISGYERHDYQKINVDGLFDEDPHRPAFAIDRPWFDHPPLFGLLTGGFAYLKGIRDFADASVIILRRPMLKISLLTTLLIFILGARLFGVWVGLLAALLYSIVPTAVISSRLALSENGYIPLFLGSLILADVYFEKKKVVYWVSASILSSIALLFKISAVVVPLTLFIAALFYGKDKRKTLIKYTFFFTLVALLIFIAYGAYFGWDTFIKVFLANTQRFYGAGAEVFFQAISGYKMTTTKFLTDGWLFFGWISLFIISFTGWKKERGATLITMAVFSYLFVLILFGSESYGWYKFPFYPFLLISIAEITRRILTTPNLFIYFALILLPIGTALHRLLGVEGFQKYVSYFRFFSLSTLLLFILAIFVRSEKSLFIKKLFIVLTFAFTIWLSIKLIYYYSLEAWLFVT